MITNLKYKKKNHYYNFLICFFYLKSIFIIGLAYANDTTAAITNNGLVFKNSSAIEMKSENLYISRNKIYVKYVFYNSLDKDVSDIVAFPIPDISLVSEWNDNKDINEAVSISEDIHIPKPNEYNFLGFKTKVNSNSVNNNIEFKAFIKDKDISEILKSNNIPLQPFMYKTYEVLNSLSGEQANKLKDNKIIIENINYGVDSGDKRKYLPLWTLKTNYYWVQIFPAKKETVIEHEYIPSVTTSAVNFVDEDDKYDYDRRYCTDASFKKLVTNYNHKRRANASQGTISYVLTTGANWSGDIRDFQLIVDKGKSDILVSFCGSNIKKISPTQYSMTKHEFYPTEDINILYIFPGDPEYPKEPQ
jgi:Domain of unknown function (DUF4424)